MAVWFAFYGILFALAVLYKREPKILIVYFIAFSVFYSLSISIGRDWKNYKPYFEHMAALLSFFDYKTALPDKEMRFELLFHIVVYALTRINGSYHWVVFWLNTIAFATYYSFFHLVAKKDSLILFTCFILFYGYKLFTSTLRQSLGVGFCCLSLVLFVDKNKKWWLCFLLAYFFHSSSIVIAPLFFIAKYINRKRFLILSTLLVAAGMVGIRIGIIIPVVVNVVFGNFVPAPVRRLIIGILYNEHVERVDFISLMQYFLIFLVVFFTGREKKYSALAYATVLFSILIKFHFINIGILIARLRYNFGFGWILLTYYCILYLKENLLIPVVAFTYAVLLSTYSFVVVKEEYYANVPYKNVLVMAMRQEEITFDYQRLKESEKWRWKK